MEWQSFLRKGKVKCNVQNCEIFRAKTIQIFAAEVSESHLPIQPCHFFIQAPTSLCLSIPIPPSLHYSKPHFSTHTPLFKNNSPTNTPASIISAITTAMATARSTSNASSSAHTLSSAASSSTSTEEHRGMWCCSVSR